MTALREAFICLSIASDWTLVIWNITNFSYKLHKMAERGDVLDDTVKPRVLLRGRRARTAERQRCNDSHLRFAVGTAGALAASQGDGTNEVLLRRQMRPDRYTHGRLRFLRANPRCLSDGTEPGGKAATDLFQVLQTLLPPFFYEQVARKWELLQS